MCVIFLPPHPNLIGIHLLRKNLMFQFVTKAGLASYSMTTKVTSLRGRDSLSQKNNIGYEMKQSKLLTLLLIYAPVATGMTFDAAINRIKNHESIVSMAFDAQADLGKSSGVGSLHDPVLRIAGKNFPRDSFQTDATPMTGVEIFLAQKFPLSKKYRNQEEAMKKSGEAKKWQAVYAEKNLVRIFWRYIVNLKKLSEERQIIRDNIEWVSRMIEVSGSLYANGKLSQQGLLDLKIRKSELKAAAISTDFDIESTRERLKYLLGQDATDINPGSVPWKYLAFEPSTDHSADPMEKFLIAMVQSGQAAVAAAESGYIPDLTIGVGYTKRANIDNNGDFVSLVAEMPLPISGRRGSDYRTKLSEEKSYQFRLTNYRKKRSSELKALELKHLSLTSELKLMESEALSFARNVRKITAKSYSLGSSSYMSLLQSELKLQSLLIKKTALEAARLLNTLDYKFYLGVSLHD